MTVRYIRERLNWQPGVWLALIAIGLSLLVLWLTYPLLSPFQFNAGHDFMILYGAARAVRDHQDPYDRGILLPYIQMTGIPRFALVDGSGHLSQPYVYPPLFAWLVSPLTYLSPKAALLVWRLLSAIGIFAGTYGLTAPLRTEAAIFGTRSRRLVIAALVVLAPMTVYGLYWGNPVALVYAALGCAVWALTRGERWADITAGALMTVTLLKPQLALPLAVLAGVCFLRGSGAGQRWRHVGYGFFGACLLLLLLDLVTTGPRLLIEWPRAILFLSQLARFQPDMPSLLGLFQGILRDQPSSRYLKLSVLLACLDVAVVIVLFLRLRRTLAPAALFGLLTVIWCYGTSYAHANDDLLFVPGGLVVLAALSDKTEEWIQRASPLRLASSRQRAYDLAWVALAVLALATLYLGGMLQFIGYRGYKLPTNIAIGAAPLLLLITLAILVALLARRTPSSAHQGTSPVAEAPPLAEHADSVN